MACEFYPEIGEREAHRASSPQSESQEAAPGISDLETHLSTTVLAAQADCSLVYTNGYSGN